MFLRFRNFVRGVSVTPIGKLGVILTTSSVISFVVLEAARLLGVLTNAYIGLITYLAFPVIFVVGLILIPIGWYRYYKQTGLTMKAILNRQFDKEAVRGEGIFGSKLFMSVAVLSLANVVILFVASSRMLQFMDEPEFCGTACHSVMNPEWVTYQRSPHARVKCVDCHVGEGVDALIDSKLNGMWQMISVTFDLYERPIPTPVHQLRPARETCEKCHWPEKFYGSRIKQIISYDEDSASTPEFTTLNLKVDAGVKAASGGIHWHIAEENEVRYASVDDERNEMIWVEVRQPDGTYKRYTNTELIAPADEHEYIRTLDCIDCHNRATHIYENPAQAIDERIKLGILSRDLPFIKKVGLSAITGNYADSAAAMAGIENELHGYYRREFPDLAVSSADEIDSAITALRSIYNRNIHHEMNITWGSYPSHIGHEDSPGCFRCHTPDLEADDGSHIADYCTLCHSILAWDDTEPYKFLFEPDTTSRDFDMHNYLRAEFLKTVEGVAATMPTTHAD
ncbi:cytochrome C [candidate division GN15 bacterium]|nr:cytochrome C [candidate division GN15 bacterium]